MRLFAKWREKYLADPDRALTVAHVPARLGSSRIPRKNLRELGGLPLIAYTVLAAKNLPGVDRVYVNTESPEIAETARAFGAEVPFLRPAELAGTDSPMSGAVQYFYDWLRDGPLPVKKVITLLPTSPFRNLSVLGRMLRALDDHVFVYSALRFGLPWERLVRPEGGELRPVFAPGGAPAPRRGLKYIGQFYGHSCAVPWEHRPFFQVFLPQNPLEAIDIDRPEDWEAASSVISGNHYDFGFDPHAVHH
ncbi:MAG: hypothetical protein AB7D57_03210 [Desulfovibrionaceae bacterium]